MTEFQLKVIKWFIDKVNEHAEQNMLKTGKLEGAHKAAMDQVLKECEVMPRTEPEIGD